MVVSHGALYNYLRYVVDEMRLNANSKISCYASFSFDISIEGLLAPLMAGGACLVVPSSLRKDISALEAYLWQNGATGGCFPTQIGQLLGKREALDMEYVTLIGEKMTVIPGNRGHVYNAYGPTECTVVVTYYDVRKDQPSALIPIGKPMYNTSVLVLDPFGNPLPDGAIGELCVAGPQLAQGYHNQPEKTAQAFSPLPLVPSVRVYHTGDLGRVMPDGNLMCLGRVDRQVKHLGHRVEPGEIESVARRQPGVEEAVVRAVDDKLILYYTVESATPSTVVVEEALVHAMKAELPHYLHPDGYMRLDTMPLTPNGKVDVGKLPTLHHKTYRYTPPGNEIERSVCQLMASVLHMDKVGINDDFFELGGNSLSAVQFALALGEGFEVNDIYQGRTVLGILNGRRGKRRFLGFERLGIYPLTDEQKKYFFVSDIGARPEISYGNVATLFHLPADEDLERLKSMLIQVIDNHPYLRVRYRESPDEHAEPTEWYVAMRDDAIPAEVFLIHAQKLPRSEMVQPYNLLGDENLYRVVLYDTEEEGKYLYLDFHHILVDEASCLIMFDDLKTLMAGKELIPEEASGYEAAMEECWRKKEDSDEICNYYQGLLSDCDSSVNDWINKRRDIHTLLERDVTYDEQKGLACVLGSRIVRETTCRVGMRHVRERCERSFGDAGLH